MSIKSITVGINQNNKLIRSVKHAEYIRQRDEKRQIKLNIKQEKIKNILELANKGKKNKEISTILNIPYQSVMQLKKYARANGIVFNVVQLGRPKIQRHYCPTCHQIVKNTHNNPQTSTI